MNLTKSVSLAFLMIALMNPCAGAATSVSQFGITWTFHERPAGQFANGDYWVVGPVTILGIEPKSVAIDGHVVHGSMVNPNSRQKAIGYDNKVCGNPIPYDETLNVAWGISAAKPLVLPPGSSLVSTISFTTLAQRPQLERAAVLTVLAAPAPPGSFRPPYCGTDKTIRFNKSMLNYSLLKRLAPVAGTPTLATVEAYFAAPWLEHFPGWRADYMHPKLNMPHYGREMHTQIGVGALVLHLDFEPAEKETLLCRYVQMGIDFYGIVESGGLWMWFNDGGVAGGRKWPILFAGLMLNDPAMKAIGEKSGDYLYAEGFGPGNQPPDYIHFGEDDQTHYVTQLDVDITNGPNWKPDPRAQVKTPYSPNDIGLPEWGIRHASAPEQNNAWLLANYRQVAGPPLHATTLAALLTKGAKKLWSHDALFDYTDRYMTFSAMGGEQPGWRSMSKFTEAMWDTYRSTCGPIWPEKRQPLTLGEAKIELVPGETERDYRLKIEVPIMTEPEGE